MPDNGTENERKRQRSNNAEGDQASQHLSNMAGLQSEVAAPFETRLTAFKTQVVGDIAALIDTKLNVFEQKMDTKLASMRQDLESKIDDVSAKVTNTGEQGNGPPPPPPLFIKGLTLTQPSDLDIVKADVEAMLKELSVEFTVLSVNTIKVRARQTGKGAHERGAAAAAATAGTADSDQPKTSKVHVKVQLATSQEVNDVINAKRKLREATNEAYRKVYIELERSNFELRHDSNMRQLAKIVPNLEFKYGKLQASAE